MLVYPGATQVVYGDVPVTAGSATDASRCYSTLQNQDKTLSNISFLLSLSHNSYVFKEKQRTDTHWTARPHKVNRDLKIQIKVLKEV